jgi:hypothetical protein
MIDVLLRIGFAFEIAAKCFGVLSERQGLAFLVRMAKARLKAFGFTLKVGGQLGSRFFICVPRNSSPATG